MQLVMSHWVLAWKNKSLPFAVKDITVTVMKLE